MEHSLESEVKVSHSIAPKAKKVLERFIKQKYGYDEKDHYQLEALNY